MPKTQTVKRKRKTTPQIRARRDAADARRMQKRRRRRIIYTVIAGIVGLLVIVGFTLPEIFNIFGRTGPTAANAPGERVSIMADATHLAEGTVYANYNSTPPTSGPHYENEAKWGVYDTALPDEQVVHNLEHAGVVVSYNLRDQAQIAQLKGIVESYPRSATDPSQVCYLIMRPYSKIAEGEVALTAWGALDKMTGVNETEVRQFIDYYRGNGSNAPELPPC